MTPQENLERLRQLRILYLRTIKSAEAQVLSLREDLPSLEAEIKRRENEIHGSHS
jgi:hypothetical protein